MSYQRECEKFVDSTECGHWMVIKGRTGLLPMWSRYELSKSLNKQV